MIPESYQSATWRNVTPVDADGCMGVGFNVGDQVVRLKLSVESVRSLLGAAGDYLDTISQSPTSSGSPQVDGSSPDEGKNV